MDEELIKAIQDSSGKKLFVPVATGEAFADPIAVLFEKPEQLLELLKVAMKIERNRIFAVIERKDWQPYEFHGWDYIVEELKKAILKDTQ